MLRLGSFASVLSLTVVALALTSACSSSSTEDKEPVAETSQEITKNQLKIVGSLDYGQTSGVTSYKNPPRYVAYKFGGNTGDQIDVWARSNNGDPILWILDNNFKIVAVNDDASKWDTNAHVKVTLPANPSITHYVVVRDYWLDNMTFRITLNGQAADPAAGCDVDADCVKIEKGCCHLGNYIAVHKDKADDYTSGLNCPTPLYCPLMVAKIDHSVAQCNMQHKCELVQPKDIQCQAFSPNPHSCPPMYNCKLPIGIEDAGGKCVQFCGGFGGFMCHDPNDQCIDDPDDSCDPNNGGADCGGICVSQ